MLRPPVLSSVKVNLTVIVKGKKWAESRRVNQNASTTSTFNIVNFNRNFEPPTLCEIEEIDNVGGYLKTCGIGIQQR